jgi:hypothetical protein
METNSYVALAQSALTKAKEYLAGTWEPIPQNVTEIVLQKQYDYDVSKFAIFELETTLNKSKDELVDKIWKVNEEAVKQREPDIHSWRELELGTDWKICHQFNNMPVILGLIPLYTRELLFVQAKIEDGETTWLVGTSIEDHLNKGARPTWWCTTAHIYMSIWGFTPVGPDQTKVTRIVHVEPGGLIPAKIVEWHTDKHVKLVQKLE